MGLPQTNTVRKGGFCFIWMFVGESRELCDCPLIASVGFFMLLDLCWLQRFSSLRRRPEGFAIALWTASHRTLP